MAGRPSPRPRVVSIDEPLAAARRSIATERLHNHSALGKTRDDFSQIDQLYFVLGEMELDVQRASQRAETAERKLRDHISAPGVTELLARAVMEADDLRAQMVESARALSASEQKVAACETKLMHQHAEYSQLAEEIAAERRSHRQTWSDAAALRQRHSEMAERADRSQQELGSRLAGKAAEMAQTEVQA